MGLHDTVSWYQRKIGTYDKKQWEKTVEQRFFGGFKHVHIKSAKLKTNLIDVDLIRGSSFSKTKPKHGCFTIAVLAVVRCVFLPLFYSWWIQQTCGATYALLLVLYLLQAGNMSLYFNNSELASKVSRIELLVPVIMMLVLSFIHSEIVAASSGKPQERCRKKRARRSQKRREERAERKNVDSAESVEECGGKEASPDPPEPTVKVEAASPEDAPTGVRQRNVAWRAPLREPAPAPRATEDDGFESLASHVSSELESGKEPIVKTEAANEPEQQPEKVCVNGHHTLPGTGVDGCCPKCRVVPAKHDTDSESEMGGRVKASPQRLLQRRRSSKAFQTQEHYDSSGESDACSSPVNVTTEVQGVTTNSEECSVESGGDSSDGFSWQMDDHPFAWEFQMSPSLAFSPSCTPAARVSCTIWERREEMRADLSVLDISSAIVARVESLPHTLDFFYAGVFISILISLVPSACRWIDATEAEMSAAAAVVAPATFLPPFIHSLHCRTSLLINVMFGITSLERIVILTAMLERFCLACLFFFLAAVAERTQKHRFLYAKMFSHLTSFRRARRSHLPHFRLNKVRNIKSWLSVRSYLKRRGPQRSVDVIVSAGSIISLFLISFIVYDTLKALQESGSGAPREAFHEALLWQIAIGVFMVRCMTMAHKTNHKYSNPAVILTEQINLFLQIEQKPHKKDELNVANGVLKLAADLLKELETPYQVCGFSTNPYIYTITRVLVLSAISGVLSEILGFKLKLHNIKISK